jgi:hypothetical protein
MVRDHIVILEDNQGRRDQMRARLAHSLPPCPVTFFPTAPEMLASLPQLLAVSRLISLDNDLEKAVNSDPDPGEGRDVARYLVTQTPVCPVIIHSTNAHAAIAMEFELADAGWRVERVTPYGDLAWVDREWFWAVRAALREDHE